MANGYNLDVACKVGVLRKVDDSYKSTITSFITLAKSSNSGKLLGIYIFRADEIRKLRIYMQNIKANQDKIKKVHNIPPGGRSLIQGR